MKVKCPHCSRKFISQEFLDKHLAQYPAEGTVKLKGWATPHGFVDFKEPVTYEEACEVAKIFHIRMFKNGPTS